MADTRDLRRRLTVALHDADCPDACTPTAMGRYARMADAVLAAERTLADVEAERDAQTDQRAELTAQLAAAEARLAELEPPPEWRRPGLRRGDESSDGRPRPHRARPQ